jgi:hypothetical protein
MPKVCWVGRYAYVRLAGSRYGALLDRALIKKQGRPGYDYELLVAAIAQAGRERWWAIDWVQSNVIHLSESKNPPLKIIYK